MRLPVEAVAAAERGAAFDGPAAFAACGACPAALGELSKGVAAATTGRGWAEATDSLEGALFFLASFFASFWVAAAAFLAFFGFGSGFSTGSAKPILQATTSVSP